MKDFQGKLLYKMRGWRLLILQVWSTFIMKFELFLKKINYGQGVRFWDTTLIVMYPQSAIYIGNKCSFRSDKSSNMIGITRKCAISTHSKTAVISIGNNCGFSGTSIGASEKIVLGNDVLCGANTLITDFDWHGIQPDKRRTSHGSSKPIIIGNNVFIGYGSVVLKGVTIGDNSVIGANSVVTKDIPANVIAGGNPCKVIKNL